MRKLICISCFGLLLLSITGCQKNGIETELNTPHYESVETTMYFLQTTDNESFAEELQAGELDFSNAFDPNVYTRAKNSNSPPANQFAHGILTTTSPNTLVFSAKSDKKGVHGENYLDGSYFKNVKFSSECLTVDGNEAHFGGKITAWEAGEGLPLQISSIGVGVGWQICMAAKDNGEGANAQDGLGGGIILAPPGATMEVIEQMYEIPPGTLAVLGIETICDLSALVYSQGEIPYIFVPGENPTNVQVK